ncbi:hypothetical protein D046_8417A, partial [Vibrio parahaemolyticus V-223/04]
MHQRMTLFSFLAKAVVDLLFE